MFPDGIQADSVVQMCDIHGEIKTSADVFCFYISLLFVYLFFVVC